LLMAKEKLQSTSALANRCGISSREMFDILLAKGWVSLENDKRTLTDSGREKGGVVQESRRFGEYIAWPENVIDELGLGNDQEVEGSTLLSATALGKELGFSAQRVNRLLSELGWVERALKGWKLSEQG